MIKNALTTLDQKVIAMACALNARTRRQTNGQYRIMAIVAAHPTTGANFRI